MIRTLTKDEEQLMALASPVLIPHLERKQEILITRMIMDYRGGAQNFASHVAELAVLHDLIHDLKNKNKTYLATGE